VLASRLDKSTAHDYAAARCNARKGGPSSNGTAIRIHYAARYA